MNENRNAGIDNLILAIVLRACDDYIDLNNGKKQQYQGIGRNYEELNRFFLSNWFDVLMPKMDGKRLISYLTDRHTHLGLRADEVAFNYESKLNRQERKRRKNDTV